MLAYAQNDSHYLLELRDILAKQLEEVGRLEAVLEDSAALAKVTLPMKDHEEDLLARAGVQDLKPEALSSAGDKSSARTDRYEPQCASVQGLF